MRSGAAVLAPDVTYELPKWRPAAHAGIRSLAAVPLRVGLGDGCLLVASESAREFSMTAVVRLRRLARLTTAEQVRAVARAGQRQLARDLHDAFGQELTALVFAIDRLDEALENPEQLVRARDVRQHALNAISELRKVIGAAVAPPERERAWLLGISPLLQDLAGAGITVHLFNKLGKERLPREVEACLYHVTHEALLNIRRHAKARTVRVTVWRLARSVMLSVSDDGTGFRAGIGGGLGLTIMRERVEEIGGRFIIESTPGRGTRIGASLPCADLGS